MLPITVAIADLEGSSRIASERLLRADRSIQVIPNPAVDHDALALASTFEPRILLCGFELASAENFSLLDALCRESPGTRVILVTDDTVQAAQIMQALAMGACGYLRREALTTQLTAAIRCVDRGEVWVTRRMLGQILLCYTSAMHEDKWITSGIA